METSRKCWEAELDKLTVMILMHLKRIIVSLLMLHLLGVTKVNEFLNLPKFSFKYLPTAFFDRFFCGVLVEFDVTSTGLFSICAWFLFPVLLC